MRDPKDIIINGVQLSVILENHRKWLFGEADGERANLRSADLSSADLSSADLRFADLSSADLRSANLRFANLRFANLRFADLSSADLSSADLSSVNLSSADLSSADLSSANLRFANLRSADLSSADLSSANLRSANLRFANLSFANLRSADLSSADLRSANLRFADLSSVSNAELVISRTVVAPESGAYVGYKKCNGGIVIRLQIPAKAKRSNASGRKCRAEYVKVLAVYGGEIGVTDTHGERTEYRKGETVRCHEWDEDRWNECSGGIHHFITRIEAENW